MTDIIRAYQEIKDVVEYMAETCNTIVDIFNKFYAQTLRVAEENLCQTITSLSSVHEQHHNSIPLKP